MDLVDKQNIPRREIRQQRRKVARLFDGRAGGHTDVHAHFVGDHARKRRFAKPRRTVQQHMVERFRPPARSLDINGQIPLRLFLTRVVRQRFRAQADLAVVKRREARGHDGRFIIL